MRQTICVCAFFIYVERLPQDVWSGPALKLPLRFMDPSREDNSVKPKRCRRRPMPKVGLEFLAETPP